MLAASGEHPYHEVTAQTSATGPLGDSGVGPCQGPHLRYQEVRDLRLLTPISRQEYFFLSEEIFSPPSLRSTAASGSGFARARARARANPHG